MKPKSRRAKRNALIGLVIVGSACVTLILAVRSARSEFNFLRGHQAFSGVFRGVPSYEASVYTWRQPYINANAMAAPELTRRGFSIYRRGEGYTDWHNPDGHIVIVQGAEALDSHDPTRKRVDSSWTSVTVGRNLPDNLLTQVRLVVSNWVR